MWYQESIRPLRVKTMHVRCMRLLYIVVTITVEVSARGTGWRSVRLK